ncbi:hypothetical protein ACFFIX_08720 [Metabacillus herbersteinensis]|uniref:Uncharacterized protein n=1 Tax=Metabacillus herbersteinensis TaxID=283816 RepID=A0ABV6GDR4_9BACI
MIVKSCNGYELEKEKPNTPEDFFNRSEVVYEDESGKEQQLSVLYVRYFEEGLQQYTPFKENLILGGDNPVYLKDIVALVCLLNHSTYLARRRVYIKSAEEFSRLFEGLDVDKLHKLLKELQIKNRVVI